MISRALRAPRICLACRLNLAQRNTVLSFRALQPTDRIRRRPYSSNRLDKEKIEAIISGEISSEAAEKFFRKQKRLEQKKERRITDDDLPDWGLTKSRTDPVEQEAEIEAIEDALSEEGKTSKWAVFAKGFEEDTEPLSTPNLDMAEKKDMKTDTEVESASEIDFDSEAIFDLEDELSNERETRSQRQSDRPSRRHRQDPSDEDWEPSSHLHESPEGQPEPTSPTKRFRHSLLHDATLEISALGKPASAIIINNPNKMRRKRKTTTMAKEQSLEANMRLDWENFVAKRGEDNVASAEEAHQNIDELRPRDTNILRMRDFDKIIDALCAGFTTLQLRDYYRDYDTGQVAEDKNMLDYSWIVKQIPWRPVKTLPSTSQTPKQMYARRIMSLKWKIQIQDYVDDLGRAYVWVNPELFPLITRKS